jgi:hypothetical protein
MFHQVRSAAPRWIQSSPRLLGLPRYEQLSEVIEPRQTSSGGPNRFALAARASRP